MRVLDIALKDLLRSFRSAFLLVMMFLVPLLLTGLIYLAFGRSDPGGAGSRFNLPVTHVAIANLDQGDARSGLAAGRMLVEYLQSDEASRLLSVRLAWDEAAARAAVDGQESDVALVIPPGFTAAAVDPDVCAAITLYHDPTLTIQPGIVRLLVGEYADAFSGVKVALQVTAARLAERGLELDAATIEQIEREYVAWVQSAGHTHGAGEVARPILTVLTPVGEEAPIDLISTLLGPVMAGMVVFFAFFTGAASASSLLYEREEGTLARLFTTATPRATIFGGKFLAVVLTLAVQIAVLLLAGHLIFGIRWGGMATVALVAAGLVVAAAGFGLFLTSIVKTVRQAGPATGLIITLTGLLGGAIPTGDPSRAGVFDKLSLYLPQGWAMHGWKLAINGATPGDVLLTVAVLVAAGAVLFAVGATGFRRRFG